MRRLQIQHVTTYQYSSAVNLLPHTLRLRPREGKLIRIESAHLTIAPAHGLQWQRDVYDNAVALATFTEPSHLLAIDSQLILQHHDDQPLDFLVAAGALGFLSYLALFFLPLYLLWFRNPSERFIRAENWEALARIHNGGPTGYRRPSTLNYWDRVQSNL
ncbi:MAG: transglutaminase N-terminal domain-containing protein [Pseudomonadota bacterium]